MTRLRELDVVRVVQLQQPTRAFGGTETVMRASQVGDVGRIVHDYAPGDVAAPVVVEMVDADGMTIWLADFAKSELALVQPYSDSD